MFHSMSALISRYLPNFLLGKVYQQLAAEMKDKHCQRHTDLGTLGASTASEVNKNKFILTLFGRFGLVSFCWHVWFGKFGLVGLVFPDFSMFD